MKAREKVLAELTTARDKVKQSIADDRIRLDNLKRKQEADLKVLQNTIDVGTEIVDEYNKLLS